MDNAIIMKVCPTFPSIKKIAMNTGDIPVNVDSKTKQDTSSMEAIKNKYELPFKSANLPPLRPRMAEAAAPGTSAKPIQLGGS